MPDLKGVWALDEKAPYSSKSKDSTLLGVSMNQAQIKALDNFLYMLTSFLLNMNMLLAESSGSTAKKKLQIRVRDLERDVAESKGGDKKDTPGVPEQSKVSHIVCMPASLQLAAHNVIGDIAPVAGAVHRPFLVQDIEQELQEVVDSSATKAEFYEESSSLDEEIIESKGATAPSIPSSRSEGDSQPPPPLNGEDDYYINISPAIYRALQARARFLGGENEELLKTLYDVKEEKQRLFAKTQNL
jgi:hypothetical protein